MGGCVNGLGFGWAGSEGEKAGGWVEGEGAHSYGLV